MQQAIGLLCGAKMSSVTPNLGVRLLPYLLVDQTDESHLATPLAILKSAAASTDTVLKTFAKGMACHMKLKNSF